MDAKQRHAMAMEAANKKREDALKAALGARGDRAELRALRTTVDPDKLAFCRTYVGAPLCGGVVQSHFVLLALPGCCACPVLHSPLCLTVRHSAAGRRRTARRSAEGSADPLEALVAHRSEFVKPQTCAARGKVGRAYIKATVRGATAPP